MAVVTINAIFTERPDSPQIRKERGSQEIVRIYSFSQSYMSSISSYLPAIGDSVTGSGYIADYDVRNAPGYSILTIKFLDRLDSPNVVIHHDDEVEYDLSVNFIEKAIETKVDSSGNSTYLVKWNYNLFEYVLSAGSPGSVPAWAATANDFSDATGRETSGSYLWDKRTAVPSADPSVGSWVKIQDMTKPGVECYLVAQPVITAKRYNETKADAEDYLLAEIGLDDPGELFGFPASSGGIYRWLAFPVGITSDGDFWIAQNQYQYSDKWDTDLYSVIV